MNPNGKTSAQRKREIANAERATKLRGRLLVALEKKLNAADEIGDAAAAESIQADILKLLKDSEDRGLGTPIATVRGPGDDGEHLVRQSFDPTKLSDTALREIMAARNEAPQPDESGMAGD